ncbi:MAG TPA: glycoside hydrolase family 97 catalytic domain-containing protein [Candidatus Limnocylindrales bacterium]|nr:glycoside hydrolase family 97 catalytic domain-containing protein [Candidatus Limnocylindrales bacterium]
MKRSYSGLKPLIVLIALGHLHLARCAERSWSVSSPNGLVKMSLILNNSGQVNYEVEYGREGARTRMIHTSPMGVILKGHDLSRSLRFDRVEPVRQIDEQYELVHGKRRVCHNQAQAITFKFRNPEGLTLAIQARAYLDGVAFRYEIAGTISERLTVASEETGFALPPDARLWCAPSDKAGTYSPAYETYYESEMKVGTPAANQVGWSFPLLYRSADGNTWGLITEASLDDTYCGTRLSNTAENGIYRVAFPDPREGNGSYSEKPSSTLPWNTPWRVIVLGSLGTILESTLVTDVSPASKEADMSWIKPGRVAWSWWSDNPSPKSAAKQKKFVDLAVQMGWEYVLVDANWTIMEDGNVNDVIRYAREQNIGTLLWYNSGGPHNIVTEKPRDCFTFGPVRNFELDWLAEKGVKGAKIDFFQSDKQDVIALYQGILRDAAQKKILVNFHGCTVPRGWERTYPNLMSMEAVRGEECYIFDGAYPRRAPVQNSILPFTRNAVGPMDYTPVGLTDNRYAHLTTWAHEIALPVVFESGWLHFADRAEAYLGLPEIPKQFLKEVPVTWDETRFVAGYPGQYVILARRHGGRWYLAGINSLEEKRSEKLTIPGWLEAGEHQLTIIRDGQTARSFNTDQRSVRAGDVLDVEFLPYGGFVGVIR